VQRPSPYFFEDADGKWEMGNGDRDTDGHRHGEMDGQYDLDAEVNLRIKYILIWIRGKVHV
jgi:hypothetical protein